MKIFKGFRKAIWLIFMSALAVIMIYPLFFSLMAGLMKKEEFQDIGTMLPIPKEPNFENYLHVLSPQGLYPLLNTVLRTVWFTFILTLMACMIGYVLARLKFRGRNLFFILLLIIQVVPWVLTTIPLYVMVARLPFLGGNNWMGVGGHGLIDNPIIIYLLISPSCLTNIFLFRQGMFSLPRDFEEAAEIDGCSFLRMIFSIIVPIQKPILIVIAIGNALWAWNEWLIPFIFVNKMKYKTIPAYVGTLTTQLLSFGERNYPLLFALATVATIPPLIIFLVLQKYIVQGLASAGIKG